MHRVPLPYEYSAAQGARFRRLAAGLFHMHIFSRSFQFNHIIYTSTPESTSHLEPFLPNTVNRQIIATLKTLYEAENVYIEDMDHYDEFESAMSMLKNLMSPAWAEGPMEPSRGEAVNPFGFVCPRSNVHHAGPPQG